MKHKSNIENMNFKSILIIAGFSVLAAVYLFAAGFDSSEEKVFVEEPENETVIQDHKVDVEFGFDFERDFSYIVYLNEEEEESLSLLDGQGENRSIRFSGLEASSHELEIVAESESGDEYSSGTYVFETTKEPLVDFDYVTSYANTVEFELELFQDSELVLMLDNEEVWTADRSRGLHTEYVSLEEYNGEYDAELIAKSNGLEESKSQNIRLN